MATKSSTKCQQYLNSRTRIANKTRKQEKWIKNFTEAEKEAIRKANPIGRKRER